VLSFALSSLPVALAATSARRLSRQFGLLSTPNPLRSRAVGVTMKVREIVPARAFE
jgi:hypothetical protein